MHFKYTIVFLGMAFACFFASNKTYSQIRYESGTLEIGEHIDSNGYGLVINGLKDYQFQEPSGNNATSFRIRFEDNGLIGFSGSAYNPNQGADNGIAFLNPKTNEYQKLFVLKAFVGLTIYGSSNFGSNNIVDDRQLLEKVTSLKPYSYKINYDTTRTHYGFLAQDLSLVSKGLVKYCNNQTADVNQTELMAMLVGAVKGLSSRIKDNDELLNKLRERTNIELTGYSQLQQSSDIEFSYRLPNEKSGLIEITNINGNLVKTVICKEGTSSVITSIISAGVYVATLMVDDNKSSIRFIVK